MRFILFCLLLLFSTDSFAKGPKKSFFSLLKDTEKTILPVPVWESRPDRGNSYGLMPVFVLTDKESKAIKSLFALIGQYNETVKADVALLAYFYPKKNQEITFYGEWGQKYFREISTRYFNAKLGERFYLDLNFSYLQSPFGFYYGLGPQTKKSDKTNYVFEKFHFEGELAYYFRDHFRLGFMLKYLNMDLKGGAKKSIPSSESIFSANPEFSDSQNLRLGLSLTYDTRENGPYSRSGVLGRLEYQFSHKNLISDTSFQKFSFEGIWLSEIMKKRWTQALRLKVEKLYGNQIPFYELSSLGGSDEMRAFVPGRYYDKGKFILQIEERVRVFSYELFGNYFEVYLDPFIEIGKVFDQFSIKSLEDVSAVAGIGLRTFVPPNIIARLDFAYGSDGFVIYTTLNYPF